MPNTREKEKLTNIVCEAMEDGCIGHCNHPPCFQVERVVNALIANGVTVQELDGCIRCKDSQQMTVTISNKLVDGVNTGWLGGNLPARFCPFCGRILPQPPKGE